MACCPPKPTCGFINILKKIRFMSVCCKSTLIIENSEFVDGGGVPKEGVLRPPAPRRFWWCGSYLPCCKKDGFNINIKQIERWLSKQPVYTLHKPIRKHFKRNRVRVDGIDQQWQADLVDMTSLAEYNRGYKYLLTCIDVLSKYAWTTPLN